MNPRAFITGVSGPELSADEREFIRIERPWGFILFKRNIETPTQIQHNQALWKSVVASLGDCRVALDSMRQTLQGVKQSGSNVAAQMLRVFKLNWKEDQIKTLRSQIQSHNTALQ